MDSKEIKISAKLFKEASEYCTLNNIEDVDAFLERCATNGFNILRFGVSPRDNFIREKEGIKDFEKQKEVITPTEEGERKEEETKTEKKTTKRKIKVIKKDKND